MTIKAPWRNLLVACSLLCAGCATNMFASDAHKLEAAVKQRDIEQIENLVNQGLAVDARNYQRLRQAENDAQELLSQEYLNEYLAMEKSLIGVSLFDEYCRDRMPDFSSSQTAGGRICSEETRQVVSDEVRQIRSEQAEEKARQDDITRQEIEQGNRAIRTLEDARIFYRPIASNQILFTPNVSGGDNNYYEFGTELTGNRDGNYISWWPDSYGSLPSVGAIFVDPTYVEEGIRFNTRVTAIGKYVRNDTISLTNGGSAIVPVFEDAYLFR